MPSNVLRQTFQATIAGAVRPRCRQRVPDSLRVWRLHSVPGREPSTSIVATIARVGTNASNKFPRANHVHRRTQIRNQRISVSQRQPLLLRLQTPWITVQIRQHQKERHHLIFECTAAQPGWNNTCSHVMILPRDIPV